MTADLTIAPILNDDIPEVVALVNSAYRGESSKKGWTTEADLLGGIRTDERSLQEMLQQPGATMLIAKNVAGQIVGTVYLQQQVTRLYLGMLTVAPDIQARGIGKRLLLAAEELALQINCTFITMTVIDIRHELIDWYKRKGYHPTGEIKPFPTGPEFGIPKQALQFIVLEKKL